MKLYVDDIRNAPDDTWTVARTVTSAIRAIYQFEFETISLDHDISHQVSVGSLSRPYPCDETFQAVVYFIAEKYHEWGSQPKIILHTSNPIGAIAMREILSEKGLECKINITGPANRLEMETK